MHKVHRMPWYSVHLYVVYMYCIEMRDLTVKFL